MPVDTLSPKDKKQDGDPKLTVKELKERAAKLAPIVPPPGYRLDPDSLLKAGMPQGHLESYTPSIIHQMRDTLANSAVGRSLQQEMPKVAAALNLTPSETIQSPTYQAHGEQLLAPEYLAPAVAKLSPVPLTQAGKERVEGALGAVGNLTSGKSMATMAGTAVAAGATAGIVNPASAQVLSRLVSGGFTLDMLHGLYQQHKEYRKAVDSGNEAEAHKIQGEMGVTGIMALLTGKHALTAHPFTPVTEAPVRERTNVLHSNSMGSVRQTEGQTPTVWLNPDAWHSVMGQIYPEESSATTNGFNIPKKVLESHANDPKFVEDHPEIADLLTKAHEDSSEGGVSIAKKRDSIQDNVRVMREELNHSWQRNLSANGNYENHLKPGIFSHLRRQIPQGMYDHLLDNGYDGHDSPQMVAEAAAKFLGGDFEKYNVSLEEAHDFLKSYLDEVVAEHGTKALDELKRIRGAGKTAKEATLAEHKGTANGSPNDGLANGSTNRGSFQRLSAGGGSSPESSEGTQPRGEGNALFNRDKEKPTWYLKSERLIGDKMKGPQAAEDVHKMLLSGGVKPEEMQWTGLDDFLKSKGKDKVTPEEIREHLSQNNIKLQEVTKANKPINLNPNGTVDMTQDFSVPQGSEPKYGRYVLPEGKNYREMLLTMPEKTPSTVEFTKTDEYQGEPVYTANVRGGKATLHHSPGFPWRVDLPKGESEGGFKTAEEAMAWAKLATHLAPESSSFKSGHWNEPNILAHTRFNERTGSNGEKLLHVEEVQSDWHQKGRDKGYQYTPEQIEEAKRIREEHNELQAKLANKYGTVAYGNLITPEELEELKSSGKKLDFERERGNSPQGSVPDAPFKKTWHEMALRRLLKHAVDNGYDGLSWTPGEDQNKRYSLSHQVDKIAIPMVNEDGSRSVRIDPKGGGNNAFKMMVAPDGTVDGSHNASQFSGKKLDEVVGKDMAAKIMEAKEPIDFEGKGLEVGGSGMKGFYDKIVPDYLNKFGKKFGAKVSETKIPVKDAYDNVDWKPEEARVLHRGDQYQVWAPNKNGYDQFQKDFSTQEEADNYIKQHAEGMGQTKSVQYLPITPEMRKSVTEEGVPLFNRERRVDRETRKRVEDMTPEEMKKALLTSDVTGAPNRRAFDDAEHASPAAAIGMSDADGLKALNDKFGYAAGNELLKAKAEALKAAGLDAYHEKGDEFLYRGASPQDLKEKLDKARQILRDRIIEVTLKDGTKLHFKGADFSYGTGKDLAESENGLKEHKSERESRGERRRGELRGITQVGAADGGERPGTPK
jgi:GGDEF domain-containing protein